MASHMQRGSSIQVKIRRKGWPVLSATFPNKAAADRWDASMTYFLDALDSELQINTFLVEGHAGTEVKDVYVSVLTSASFGHDIHRVAFSFQEPNLLARGFSSLPFLPYPVVVAYKLKLGNPILAYRRLSEDLDQFRVRDGLFYKLPLVNLMRYLVSLEGTDAA